MNICVLNGSPRGAYSTTLHTALYLQKRYPCHSFEIIHVGTKIRALEKDITAVADAMARADLILFSYPVYTFIAPSQLHRFISALKAGGWDLTGKFVTQITTFKHFYGVTAHRYIEDNCHDLGMKVIHGLSADMEDLTTKRGREEEDAVAHDVYEPAPGCPPRPAKEYIPTLPSSEKRDGFDTVIVADLR